MTSWVVGSTFVLNSVATAAAAETILLIDAGVPIAVHVPEGASGPADGTARLTPGTALTGIPSIADGDATVELHLRIVERGRTGATLSLHRANLIFGRLDGRILVQEPGRAPVALEDPGAVRTDSLLDVRVERRGERVFFSIGGREVGHVADRQPGRVSTTLRSVDAVVDVVDWRVKGALAWPVGSVEQPAPLDVVVFVDGDLGTHRCRIPALALAPGGTLLAACEGRRSGARDDADTDVLLRRSMDGGGTWSEAQAVVTDEAHATVGNPTFVVDRVTGVTFLFVCRNNERVLAARSRDDGVTWSAPQDLTGEVVRPGWSWVGTGPGSGIQLTQGSAKGRLLLPVSHQDGGTPDDRKTDHRRTHVLYSDDHGETWRLSDTISALTSEASVAELADGTLVLNMRNHLAVRRRRVARSRDGGTTWTHAVNHPRLTDPDCHASLVRWPEPPEIGAESVLLFANPATSRKRERLTVRLSEDGGKTWPVEKMIREGGAGYTSLAVLPDGRIGLLYEEGGLAAGTIRFARFSVDWLRTPFAEIRARAVQPDSD